MRQDWAIGGKSGIYVYPRGEVVYQKRGVVVEPLYEAIDGKYYIETGPERLQEVLLNVFNGYTYRQDGE